MTIIVIISKSGQGKTYVEYEAGKNAGYGLVARWAGCKVKGMESGRIQSG